VSDTLDQTDGLEVCVTAGFIMTTATTWWTQSGSGTLIEPEFMRVEIVPPNNPDAANPRLRLGFNAGVLGAVADPGR